MYNSITPLRIFFTFCDWVETTIPSLTGVVQEEGVPRRPSISTTQRRQEPNASTLSVAQSLGIGIPASIAARMTEVPSEALTSKPSIVRLTGFPILAGVPRSRSFSGEKGEISVILRPPAWGQSHRENG